MNEDIQNEVVTRQLIKQSLHIETTDQLTNQEMINLIAQRVNYLLENDKDLLLSYLYRLDISMKKINNVLKLKKIIPPHQSLAMLIYQRQLERVNTKRKIKVEPIEGWEF
jgi:predicted ATPase with chaperone activity